MKNKFLFLLLALSVFGISLRAQQSPGCGTKTTPEDDAIYLKTISEFRQKSEAKSLLAPRYIPVHYHIIRMDNGTGGIDVADVDAALEIVNMRYAPIEFHFFRCEEPNYIDDTDAFNGLIQATDEIDDLVNDNLVANVVNIFFGPNIIDDDSVSTLCGFARFPWLTGNYLFMDNGCTTNGSTLSHELGHYFGLYHTHHSSSTIDPEHVTRNSGDPCWNCETGGDLLCDTEADPELSDSTVDDMTCAYTGGASETCTDDTPSQVLPYNPDPANLMSYSRKDCRDFFSAGQYARMVDFYNTVRMAQLDPTTCSNSPCYEGEIVLPMGGPSTVTSAKTARAENSITSTEDIEVFTSPGVTYKAGGYVLLDVGFSTADGAVFTAFIEDCFVAPKPAPAQADSRSDGQASSGSSMDGMASGLDLTVSPNPFSGEVKIGIALSEAGPVRLRVFNALGEAVAVILPGASLESGASDMAWDGHQLQPGVYFLLLEQGGKSIHRKVVKM